MNLKGIYLLSAIKVFTKAQTRRVPQPFEVEELEPTSPQAKK